jgi:cytochrome c oxidase subunit 4
MHAMRSTSPTAAPPHHPKVNYYAIFALLVAATILTVLVAMHRYESEIVNVGLCLGIASIKACLVAAFFMHLRFESKLIYFIATIPLLLCIILVVSLLPDVSFGQLFTHAHTLFPTP